MQLPVIEMQKPEARKAFLEYRRAVKERHNVEDEALLRIYRNVSQGKMVINIFEAMHAGGDDAKMLPRLAFVRADSTEVFVRREANGSAELVADPSFFTNWGRTYGQRDQKLLLPEHNLPERILDEARPSRPLDARAVAPVIPPALRPAHALSNYHLLWEADWKKFPQPRDPALLKHLGGPFYAVLAMWDVTPVEAAVIGVTRN